MSAVEVKAAGDVLEAKVGRVSEWPQVGHMLEKEVGKAKVLVVRTKAGLKACGRSCTHYGAPLIKGVLQNDRVICPWHGACFNVGTGDIEEAPALKPIPTYPLRVDGNDVYVTVPQTPDHTVAVPVRASKARMVSNDDNRVFVVVGGGAACMGALEELVLQGFPGRVVVISADNHAPVDRTKLSKAIHLSLDKIFLRPPEWFDDNHIELRLNMSVVGIDTDAKQLNLSDGSSLEYTEVLLATGASARKLSQMPGNELDNVFYIRSPADSAGILKAVTEQDHPKVVVIGSGFIGMEAVCWLLARKISDITVVSLDEAPFNTALGSDIANHVKGLHVEKGVKFIHGTVAALEGKDAVSAAQVKDGPKLEASIVIIGIGAIPNTEFLKDSKVALSKRGGVVVDAFLKSGSGPYAAGDIAQFPYRGQPVRIEHWNIAENHGMVAARNMLGQQFPFQSTPYFWTSQFGSIRYCGYGRGYKNVVFVGDLAKDGKAVGFYIASDNVVAVVSVGMDPYVSACAELFRLGRIPSLVAVQSAAKRARGAGSEKAHGILKKLVVEPLNEAKAQGWRCC